MKYLQGLIIRCFYLLVGLLLLGAFLACYGYYYLQTKLPDVENLSAIHLQVPMKIYTSDGLLIGEYGEKRRHPVALKAIPPLLVKAVLATEDQRFYQHAGVDFVGLVRAAKILLLTGKKEQGASTITMQVARNFFLSRKKTYRRKFNEILLALMIDHKFSKDKILNLYLNKIYLGNHAYGVSAAAKVYYGKALSQLNLAQLAMIAGLAQAPSANNPIANPKQALKRRNHVLDRLYGLGEIKKFAYQQARHAPVSAHYHRTKIQVDAPYLRELVRQAVYDKYGNKAYSAGFQIYTTVNSHDQAMARQAVQRQLIAYDHRHGYRKPQRNWGEPLSADTLKLWQQRLTHIPTIANMQAAAVLQVNDQSVNALLANGQHLTLNWPSLAWAHTYYQGYAGSPMPKQASDIVNPGDVIRVYQKHDGAWQLAQLPKVEGALVALNPQSGALIAAIGGFSFKKSNFNRAMQGLLQPGSSFKPFIYSAALAQGFSMASTINDAPVVVKQARDANMWRPQNSSRHFFGPTRLRVGLIKSRNIVSIRLLQRLGLPYTIEYMSRFGFDPKHLPKVLSLALGTAQVTPVEMASAYALFANGGYKIRPYFIKKITDTNGHVLFQADPARACPQCHAISHRHPRPPNPLAPQVITPQNAYIINSALEDVIQHGTGRRARALGRHDLAGKTGTTNNRQDAWFAGYNADVVAVTWVGFDHPQTLREYGERAALPVWMAFMQHYLAGKPEHSLPLPTGLIVARIDPHTGLRISAGSNQASLFEIFRQSNLPAMRQSNQSATSQHALPKNREQSSLF